MDGGNGSRSSSSRRRKNRGKEVEYLRKGTWNAEEDEVLLSHVRRHGPRDWSSIRSNGLLQRTGKSCRLRWVNKLRPNLKKGCKFSGRTDNDVKNFWSSRQKRLARILQASSSSSTTTMSSSRLRKNKRKIPASRCTPQIIEGLSAKSVQCCSSDHGYDHANLKPQMPPHDVVNAVPQLEIPLALDDSNILRPELSIDSNFLKHHQPHSSCHDFSNLQSGFPFGQESQGFLQRLDDPEYFNLIGPEAVNGGQFSVDAPFLQSPGVGQSSDATMSRPFLEDLPSCMPDQFEQLPSPSRW